MKFQGEKMRLESNLVKVKLENKGATREVWRNLETAAIFGLTKKRVSVKGSFNLVWILMFHLNKKWLYQQLDQMKLKKNLDPWPRVPEEPDFDGHCRELDTLYIKDLHKKVLPSLFLLLITMLPSLLCPFCPPDHSWVPPPSFPTPTIMRCVFPPPRPLWGSTILPDHYEVSLPLLEGGG